MPGRRLIFAFAASILGSLGTGIYAQDVNDRWFLRGDFQGLLSEYSGTQERDALGNLGLFIRADYLDRGGITIGYNRTVLSFQDGDQPDIKQDNLFLSGRWRATPDWAPGSFTFRLDGHVISNNDSTNGTDDVTAIAPQLSFLNYQESFYLDIGYSVSSYGDSLLVPQALEIDQLTPTLGFGFNEQRDWLQFRAYLIDASSSQRAQDQEDSAALELKWTHWPTARGRLGIDNFRVSTVLGERIFAVDQDAGGIYNLSDLQTGAAAIGAEWALNERNRVLVLLGLERYENRAINEDYQNTFLYFNFTHEWN